MSRIIQLNQLKTGDIILFITEKGPKPQGLKNKAMRSLFGLIGWAIGGTTKSKYTHAAICYDTKTIVHAPKFGMPVSFGGAQDTLDSCKRAAVFRSAWAFGGSRPEKLKRFLKQLVDDGVPYNLRGLLKYWWSKKKHEDSLQDRVEAFFTAVYPGAAYSPE